jgi:hypothetical protein
MNLKDAMAADVVAIFLNANEFAEYVEYKGKIIKGVFARGHTAEKGNVFSAQGETDRATLSVSIADVPAPQAGDSFVINGTTWSVARIIASDAGMHDLECTANESALPAGW